MKIKEIESRAGRAPLGSDNEIVRSPPVQYPIIPCIIANDNVQYVVDENKKNKKNKKIRHDTVVTKIPFFQKTTEKTVFVKHLC